MYLIVQEESSPLLFTWFLFASLSECRLFTNSYTTPSSGLGNQIQRKLQNAKEKEEDHYLHKVAGAISFANLCNSSLYEEEEVTEMSVSN